MLTLSLNWLLRMTALKPKSIRERDEEIQMINTDNLSELKSALVGYGALRQQWHLESGGAKCEEKDGPGTGCCGSQRAAVTSKDSGLPLLVIEMSPGVAAPEF